MRKSLELDHVLFQSGHTIEMTPAELETYPGEAPYFVIYLVHGTWSPTARWVSYASRFSERLSAKLENSLLLDRVRWSGKNSATARKQATLKLRLELRQRIAQFPNSVHVIIAHSHGGNIALQAICEGNLHTRVGLVSLSTPFLDVRRRRIPTKTEELIGLGILALTAIATYPILNSWSRAHNFPLWLKTSPWVSWADLKADDVLAWPLVPLLLLFTFLFKRSRRKAEALWDQLHYDVPAETMLKILRTRGDEVSDALSAYHLGSWLIATAIGSVTAIVTMIQESRLVKNLPRHPWLWNEKWKTSGVLQKAAIFSANCVILSAIVFCLVHASMTARGAALSLFIAYLALLTVVPFVAGVLVGTVFFVLLMPLALLGALSFGLDALIAALIYEITAEVTPEGTWSVSLLPISNEGLLQNRLMHGALYDSDAAIDQIADWIRQLPANHVQRKREVSGSMTAT
jgi:hypothetical protein